MRNLLAVRLRQAGLLAAEIAPALRALGRVVRAIVRPVVPVPAVATLAAPAPVHDGRPTPFHVRVVNPTSEERALDVVVEGRIDGRPSSQFRAAWAAVLPPGTVDERWVVTAWRGDGVVHATPPPQPFDGPADASSARWMVTAALGGGTPLRIGGPVVQ